ncbi:calcium-activated chloride channel regulator 1-like isoform X2 [Lineus longissimus]|uniref:calcium-activated chloride channel regulator 1-like isoform X2 n=1 Tax=Lineus longissimus TaxID=88925 RepID=UPI00315D1B43
MKTSVGSILLFLCLEGVHVFSADIILRNNGYENVLVAISDSVPEDPKIIKRIKAIFTDGSGYMYRATRYRAYFRNITILVPAKWKNKPEYEAASNDETYVKAALRVAKPNPKTGDTPYAFTYALCGKQAMYIHLTPKFLTDVEFATKWYGPPGKTLVHEWGHFRWGLFDEYPTSTHYYVDKGTYHPTRCHSSIPGKHRDKLTKENCEISALTGLPDGNCRFSPDLDQKATTASYMYMQFIKNIDDFCDDGTLDDQSIVHNKKAPNNQNSICKRMSAWEVMRQSVDFKNNNNPANVNEKLDTTPTFRFIQRGNLTKVLFLIDVSGSMIGRPITMMQQAANNFILNIIRNDSYVGIATFASSPKTRLNMTRIQSEADRVNVTRYIPREAGGGTRIGTGMQHAISLLISTPGGITWAKGACVILMTDGKNGGGVDPLSLIHTANEYGITFYTIGYSDASDPVLEEIARRTGGQFFFSTSSATSADLFNAMSAIAGIESEGTASSSAVTIASSAKNLEKIKGLQGKFAIDFTIGKDTTITFNYLSHNAVVEVHLEGPDRSVIDKSDIAKYREDRTNQVIQINIPGTAMKGEWNYTVASNVNTAVLVNVLSKPVGEGEDAAPISIKSWFGDDNNNLASGPAAQTSVFAQVSRGYVPVIGLKVTAAISGRIAGLLQTVHVNLQDKGFGIDLKANDGVYSVEFGRFLLNEMGRYSVTILVDNSENTGKIAKYSNASGAPIIGTGPNEPVTTYQTVGPIQRVASAGELRVDLPSSPTLVDVLPPPQIRDLQLVLLDTKKVEVTLNWTAVGDDVSQSSNMTYDLRIGTFEEISERFENSSRIHLEGTPKNAGEKETHKINMTDYSKTATYFLAIRAIDEVGNEGDPSNIISISMTLPNKFSNGDVIAIATEPSPSTLSIILIFVGISAVILIAVVVGFVCLCKKKKTPSPDRSEDFINLGREGPTSNPPQVVYNGEQGAVYHVGQEVPRPSSPQAFYGGQGAAASNYYNVGLEGLAPPSYTYANKGYSNVGDLRRKYEGL